MENTSPIKRIIFNKKKVSLRQVLTDKTSEKKIVKLFGAFSKQIMW